MRILADLHHGDLFTSLQHLFVKRLGWQLYRPIGLDWYHEDFWMVFDHINTANQYLGMHLAEPHDAHGNPVTDMFGRDAWVNRCMRSGEEPGTWTIKATNSLPQCGVELAAAKEMKFDVILSSYRPHFNRYERFRQLYCPDAKHIYQSGNSHIPPAEVVNFLNSTLSEAPHVPNHIHYHQEFDLVPFENLPCENPRSIVNLMHFQELHYGDEFKQLQHELLGWEFKDYGGKNADGNCHDIPAALGKAGFLWHAKRGGDGYGYNLHNAAAAGRPIITHFHDYQNEMGAQLLSDGVTMFDLDRRSLGELPGFLNAAADEWPTWHARVKQRFHDCVDFDAEFAQISVFLTNLQ